MRTLFAIVAVLVAATARAQNPDTTPSQPPRLRDSIESEIAREVRQQTPGRSPLFLETTPANEMKLGGLTCDGILVQAAKDNPLELINPTAGPEFGSPVDNSVWDPTGQRVTGWKVFSIKF